MYVFYRRLWRPRHWNPAATLTGQVDELFTRPALVRELFYLERGAYRGTCSRLRNSAGLAGNPLVDIQGSRGKEVAHTRLYSIYRKGRLLDKHGELAFGNYDPVHHGLILPFGNIHEGQVIRYLDGPPLLTLEAAGLFLWALCLANRKAIQEGFLEDEGFAHVRQSVSCGRRETQGRLRINLYYEKHAEGLQMLERLGWIRPDQDPDNPSTFSYQITEAPADLLEMIVLAIVAQLGEPLIRASSLVDEIADGTRGIVWVLNEMESLGWSLTEDGEERLKAEIVNRRLAATTFEPSNPIQEAILDTIRSMCLPQEDVRHLEEQALFLISLYGEGRVLDVLHHARKKRQTLENPVGWITAALKAGPSDWPIPPAPFQGLNPEDYGPDGKYAGLLNDE